VNPLDNVIWSALTTRQAGLGTRFRSACKFDAEVSVLGAVGESSVDAYASLVGLLAVGERVGLFVDGAVPAPGLSVVSDVPLLQMVRGDQAVAASGGEGIVELTRSDVPEMLALTARTQPGPFDRRTCEMGDYFGLRVDGVLVAMAGERLHVPGHTELSAICTHPDHLGRGYAAALMRALVRRILARGERPFLHVRPENTRAIAVYERMGFERRLTNRYVLLERSG
jgi:ribosomal protein S18 acetylase RimI-like enzyme